MARWPRGQHPARWAGTGARRGIVAFRPASPAMERYVRQVSAPIQPGQFQTTVAGGTAQVTLGPTGAGVIWYPAQVTVSTTTGTTSGLDTSICNIYLGPAGVPVTLLGTVFGGNGILAAALPNLQGGQYLIAVWTGAHNGDTAAVNITGTMTALDAG
jgi:hypothetical protein